MPEASLNLTVRDFDAYLPEKATSNAFARPRMEVKQRALAWGRRVLARLAEQGIHADLHASDEHLSLRNKKRVDCQWVYFWRDQRARDELDRLLARGRTISEEIDDPSPFKRHAFLALRIDAGAVEICFAVHPDAAVDVENLRARLATAEQGGDSIAAELTTALRKLPEQFTIGVAPADRAACSAVTPQAIVLMLQRAADGQEPLWIGWTVSRSVALDHVEILDEQLEDATLALAPVYRLVAWSQENDHIALDRRLEGDRLERARTHAEAEAETARWRAERAAARERSIEVARARRAPAPDPGKRPSLATLFSAGPQAAPHPTSLREVSRPAPRVDTARVRPGAPHPGPALGLASAAPAARGPGPRAISGSSSSAAIEKGSRVRVLAGAFVEKLGVVNELDGRGGARVLLGLLSTRLDVEDLEPIIEGRDRPALQSSHRRPGGLSVHSGDPGTAAKPPAATPPRKAR